MARGKLILITQYGGEFVKKEDDGTLSYHGGVAEAVTISSDTFFDDLKLKAAETSDLNQETMTMKYFLPGNRRNLIMLKNDKDLRRMLEFHGNSVTADVFLSGQKGFNHEAVKIDPTRVTSVKVAETVSHAPLSSPPPTNRQAQPLGASDTDGGDLGLVSDALVDVNVILEIPRQITNPLIPLSGDGDRDRDVNDNGNGNGGDHESDYAAPQHVSVADATGDFDADSTPAATVKKRRRTASWKVGAKVTLLSSDADDAPGKRPRRKRGGNIAVVHDEMELKGVPVPGPDDLDSPYALVIRNQELPENLVASWRDGITGVGQDFESVKDFRDTLQKYAIAHRFVYKLKKNDTNRASGTCVGEGCPWRIHASWVPASQSFQIKKFDNQHTCDGEAWKSAHPGRNWLVGIIKDRLKEFPHHKPKDIANGILQDFGIELNYTQVWRGLEHAREQLQGSHKISYNHLPSFCEKVVETNPGSFAKLVTKDDKRFQCLFVSFHGLLHGFQNGCRPLLFLESTPLKSKYQEFLLTATAVDADDGFLPVAFAIVDAENNDSWQWFLQQLKSSLSTSRPITFVFDRDKELKSYIFEVFEDATLGYSMSHLVESFRRSLRGPFNCSDGRGMLPNILVAAAQSPRAGAYQKLMDQIKHMSAHAYDWLNQVEPEYWNHHLFKGEPYHYMTENVAEPYIKLMDEVQETTILHKIEALIGMIRGLVESRQTQSSTWSTKLTPSVEIKLQQDMVKAISLKVLFSSDFLAEVHDDLVNVVNIETQECTCAGWKANLLPCRHAIAVLLSKGRDIYDFCPEHFSVESFRSIYSVSVNPIPDIVKAVEEDEAAAADADADSMKVLPPNPPKLTTQQKKELARMEALNRRTVTCTRCKEPGHNKASCKATL